MFISKCTVYIYLAIWIHSPFSTLLCPMVDDLEDWSSDFQPGLASEEYQQEVGDGGRARQGVGSSVFPPTGHEVWLHPSPKDCSLVPGSPFHMSFSDSGSGNYFHPLPHKLCSDDGAPPFLGPGGWTTPCDSTMHCPPSLSIVTLLHSLLFNYFNCVICFLPGLSLLCPENLTQN